LENGAKMKLEVGQEIKLICNHHHFEHIYIYESSIQNLIGKDHFSTSCKEKMIITQLDTNSINGIFDVHIHVIAGKEFAKFKIDYGNFESLYNDGIIGIGTIEHKVSEADCHCDINKVDDNFKMLHDSNCAWKMEQR